MKLAVVGATGMVGNVMLEVLKERNFPFDELILVASEKSKGKEVSYNGKTYTLHGLQEAVDKAPHIAIFSAGGSVSKEWAPKFAAKGTTVVDNSSAWRMEADKKLVVPEINARLLTKDDKIIANPNCSTIQMVLALLPIHRKYGIKRLVISTYQSVTGTGVAAVQQLEDERQGNPVQRVYPHQIDKNCLPHGGDFGDNGYTSEEMKLVNETRKILGDNDIQITATVVRVPVIGGHSESINVELKKDFDLNEIRKELASTPGITVQDDPLNNVYPMPISAHHKDDVFVGRLRRDVSVPFGLDMWVVSDNLRKGAATNAIQIAEYLLENKLI
ncbi:MAG: aspartate-semialdehyde dehydrogenase [Flavobacteriales bacterium]|nr:aspartate-semialdehyde dehydrogenase [Flavobacteriales bacterium]